MNRLRTLVTAVSSAAVMLIALWGVLSVSSAQPATAAPADIPFPDQRDALTASIEWMVMTHQRDDGGYTAFSNINFPAPSNVVGTLDAILAIASAGYNPAIPLAGEPNSPITYLQNNVGDVVAYANDGGGEAGKVVMALVAAGQNPRNFVGVDFVGLLNSKYDADTGGYANTVFLQSLAILGLSAASQEVPAAATEWLTAQQETAGSWSDGFGTADNNDATAMAVMALRASGTPLTATTLISATNFFSFSQQPEGGWGYAPSFSDVNASSTALVVQALSALEEDFYTTGSSWATDSITTPMTALLDFQNSTGAFQDDVGDGPFDDFYSTSQAAVAATGKPYPLPGRYQAALEAIGCLATLQDPTTAGWPQFGNIGSNAAGTSRAIEAIVAFGGDPAAVQWTISNTKPISALETLTPDYLTDGGRAGVVLQGVIAAGTTYTDFAGYNLPISITEFLTDSGAYAPINFGISGHAEAMLGLILAGEPVAPTATQLIYTEAITGDVWDSSGNISFDATGLAINVLSRLNEPLPTQTLTTTADLQLPTGGWQAFGSLSVNSTSEVVQGLYAAGEQPYSPSWSQVVSGVVTTSADAVMAAQAESGCWQPFGGDDAFATTDGILMLMVDYMPPPPAMKVYLPLLLNN